jgi:hypothetical protein
VQKAQPKTGRNDRSYTRGFVQASGLLARRITGVGEKRGFAESRLLTHWAEIVGAETAAIARPEKITYREGFGATLIVLCTGARAPELEMQLPVIRERVNACYGYNAIARIRVTQTSASGFSDPQTPFAHKPKEAQAPDPTAKADLDNRLDDIADTGLRDALAALGDNVLSRAARGNDLKGTK